MEGTLPPHSAPGERKRRRLAEKEFRESTERAFEAYGAHLENVTSFKYMGQVMTAGDYDWPELVGKPHRARKSWGWLLQILIPEGEYPNVSGHFSSR